MKFLHSVSLAPAALIGMAFGPLAVIPLSACHSEADAPKAEVAARPSADPLAFTPAPAAAQGPASPAPGNPLLRAQVALDRQGFSPGVIDGKDSAAYGLALRGFQQAHGLAVSGRLDTPTQQALLAGVRGDGTRRVTIPLAFARGPFHPDLPRDMAGQARFDRLGYRSMSEALAERFHTTPETLLALNGPGTVLGAGRVVRVPDIADAAPKPEDGDTTGWSDTLVRLGVAADQPRADHLVVDKSDGALRAYDKQDRLIAQFPVTTGSGHDPLPLGTWKIVGAARNPDYHFNPDLFWDAKKNAKDKLLPPGPNGPVGVVWLDLSKEHYGIHGTPEPQNIGKTESHGCVRLTNWDAARLAQMVSPGITVVFQA